MRFIFTVIVLLCVVACSTEKNTMINRTYHGTTAHYNGYFNARELISTTLTNYQTNRKDDFYNLIPLNPLPNDEEVKGMFPALDTAIAKCKEVISKHSMPTASEPSKKRSEFNPWIDENWLTIGQSNFYKKDYENALKNFKYINKFFSNDPSNYTAAIWMAKTHIETRNFGEANLLLMELDKKVEELENAKSDKKSSSKKSRSKKKSKKGKKSVKEEEEPAEFTKKDRFLLECTKAELAIIQNDTEKAITNLEEALKFAKKSSKARIHYLLAQLNVRKSNSEQAKYHYGKVLRYNAPFEMNFSARINRALMGGDEKIKKELQKMLKDEKNVEYKDQIYFALAEIALKEGNKPLAVEYLHKSVINSTNNNRQKAICYEKLGDFSFTDRDYVKAQKYYDSCSRVLPEDYPNALGIRNKATKLKDLVIAVETAAYEDSVQRIAKMSEEDRLKFAEKLIKKMKEDEKRRIEEEARRLKEIQEQQIANDNGTGGNKNFWNSPKLRSEGLEQFRKQWGARENEDNWRRSDKIVMATFKDQDSTQNDTAVEESDSLTPESLLANLPLGDSLLKISTERMLAAYYDAGIIYKDQLNESQVAAKQFESVVSRKSESKYHLMSLYQLYKIYETADATKAYPFKTEILADFPNSDYANYLRDPDFFAKRKEALKIDEDEYVETLNRYNMGLYALVIGKANQILENSPENKYRSKYALLKALAVGQSSKDKSQMTPALKDVVKNFPGTPEEARAKELLQIQEKGFSSFTLTDFTHKSIYSYVDDETHWIMIFVDSKQNANAIKTRVADFVREKFNKEHFNVSTKVYGKDENVVIIKEMTEAKADEVLAEFKKSRKMADLLENKMFMISSANLKILFETLKLKEYEDFYSEFY